MNIGDGRYLTICACVVLLATGCPPGGGGADADGGIDGGAPDGESGSDVASESGDDAARGDSGEPTPDAATDATSDSADADDSLTLRETFYEAARLLADGYCSAAFQCPQKIGERTRRTISRREDLSKCKSERRTALVDDEFITDLKSDIQKGLTKFLEDEARKCLQKLRSRVEQGTCRNLLIAQRIPESCRDLLEGTQPQGDPCDSGNHCQSGRCDFSANSDKCYGACEAPPTYVDAGEKCNYDTPQCDPAKELLCLPRDPNDSGSDDICKHFATLSSGEACRHPFRCKSGLNCIDNTCQAASIQGSGDPCEKKTQRCEVGLVCSISVTGSGSNETAQHSCASPRISGGNCYREFECEAGLYCDGAKLRPSSSSDSMPGSCTPKKPNGDPCNDSSECESGYCDMGACAPVSSGDSCTVPTGG